MTGADPASRPLDMLPWAGLAALLVSLGLNQISSYDYWWMLRTGQLIAETGAVPTVDPYTYSAPGARWIDIHWLHQLGLWGLYRLGGHTAVGIWQFAAMLLVVALMAPLGRRPGRSWLSVLALALMLVNAGFRFSPRPESSSFVLLAAVLALLDRFERTGDAWIYAVVALQVVWVNLHGLFALGIALCGIHLVSELLESLVGSGSGLRLQRLKRLGTVTLLASLSALLNPNGLEGALYPLQQLAMIGPEETRAAYGVIELRPTLAILPPIELSCFLAIAALSGTALALNWRRAPIADVLIWVAFLTLALGAIRNVAIFSIAAAPLLVRNANLWLDTKPRATARSRWASLAVFALVLVPTWDAARGEFYTRIGYMAKRPGFGVTAGFNPERAVDWIAENTPPAPIAHPMKMGGYLAWRLHPDYRVLVDGRLEVFGAERFRQLAILDDEDFARLDEEFGFGTALVRFSLGEEAESLVRRLHEDPDWRLVYVDDFDSVYVRADTSHSAVDLDAPGLFETLDGSAGWFDELRLRNRTLFFTYIDRFDLALSTWNQLLARFPEARNGRSIQRWLESETRP